MSAGFCPRMLSITVATGSRPKATSIRGAADSERDIGPQQEDTPEDFEVGSESFFRCAGPSMLEGRAIDALLRRHVSAARRAGTPAPVTAWLGMEETGSTR